MGEALGRIVSLLVWLFGLIAVLQARELNSLIGPVQTLINSFMAYIPRISGAGAIIFVGLMIARIVRDIVQTMMAPIIFDKWASKLNNIVRQSDGPGGTRCPAHRNCPHGPVGFGPAPASVVRCVQSSVVFTLASNAAGTASRSASTVSVPFAPLRDSR